MLREIRGGRIPRNVAGVQPGEEVEMVVVKREMEEWTPAQSRGTTTSRHQPSPRQTAISIPGPTHPAHRPVASDDNSPTPPR
jgi:hypothetical protein